MRLINGLLDLLFPPKCIICHRLLPDGVKTICPACFDALPNFDGAEPPVRNAARCVVTFWYEDKLRQSFLRYKFHGLRQYAGPYGKWMSVTIRDRLSGQFDLVSWVPVSRRRKAKRGFDQAELLCQSVCRELGCGCVRTLRKTVDNPAQSAGKDRAERAANVLGAYRPVDAGAFADRRILLIDDIVTSGATLGEACRVLKQAGAKEVVCAAFAAPRERKE